MKSDVEQVMNELIWDFDKKCIKGYFTIISNQKTTTYMGKKILVRASIEVLNDES